MNCNTYLDLKFRNACGFDDVERMRQHELCCERCGALSGALTSVGEVIAEECAADVRTMRVDVVAERRLPHLLKVACVVAAVLLGGVAHQGLSSFSDGDMVQDDYFITSHDWLLSMNEKS